MFLCLIKSFSFVSLTVVGAPRVPHDEGTEKPILPKFCHFLQKQQEVWLWLSLHYFYERDRNFVKETLFRANCIAYSHLHTNIYKAMARSGSKFSTSLHVLYNLCITESSDFRKKIYRFLSFLIGKESHSLYFNGTAVQ